MDLQTLLSYDWGMMSPEFTIVITATLLSLIDLFISKKTSRNVLAWLGFAGIVIAIAFVFGQLGKPADHILNQTYRLDSFSKMFKLIFLTGAGLIFLMAIHYKPKSGLLYRGEFYYLMMTALLGAMVMASSADLITLFVGLELLSVSSYILAGIRKKDPQSNEAAMKYVINGGISTAITLFGISYIYGLSGSTNLYEIAGVLSQMYQGNLPFILGFAYLMIFVGLSFKIASVPFQMWAPDVYQGSPIPVTAFLSVVSKAAGFVLILRIIILTFIQAPGFNQGESILLSMTDYVAILAGITMIVGNTIALHQKNIKRLFAFSSIAHAGYLLVPFIALSSFVFEGIWFYLVAYLLMNIGAFAIIQVIIQKSESANVDEFAGLYHKSPIVAVLMSIFLLSLAGIPGTAGFIGKLNIFLGALQTDHYVLVSIMMATTVISYFYYFGIMKQMFMRPEKNVEKVKLPAGITAVVSFCVIGTLLFGIMPSVALDFFYNSFNIGDFIQP